MKTISLNPYLNFDGNCEEAFNFYKSVFGGDFSFKQKFKDIPKEAIEAMDLKEDEWEKIMHIALPVGPAVLYGCDNPKSMQPATFGDNISLTVEPESEKLAKKIFDGLSAGGEIKMPLAKAFWGALFGMCTDKFGVRWMVNCILKK